MRTYWPQYAANDATLTPRQQQVLEAVAVADSIDVAAHRLGIAPATLKNHLTQIHVRLGVPSTTQCVYVAMRSGLLS